MVLRETSPLPLLGGARAPDDGQGRSKATFPLSLAVSREPSPNMAIPVEPSGGQMHATTTNATRKRFAIVCERGAGTVARRVAREWETWTCTEWVDLDISAGTGLSRRNEQALRELAARIETAEVTRILVVADTLEQRSELLWGILGSDMPRIPLWVSEMGTPATTAKLRRVVLDDYFPRLQLPSDGNADLRSLRDCRILITGAAGSIGSAVSRYLQECGARDVWYLDQDEIGLHSLAMELGGNPWTIESRILLADIRDQNSVQYAFDQCRPDIVVHAAALKYLSIVERFPHEAQRSNVEGTLNVYRCAARMSCRRVVYVSTDKAAAPTSILGITKRAGENLGAWFDAENMFEWVGIRLGNVVGSRGSVTTVFEEQIRQGRAITLTESSAQRFVMTAQAAAEHIAELMCGSSSGYVAFPLGLREVSVRQLLTVVESTVAQHAATTTTSRGLAPGEKVRERFHATESDGALETGSGLAWFFPDACSPSSVSLKALSEAYDSAPGISTSFPNDAPGRGELA